MTRVQKERFSDLMEYERVKNVYILKNDMLKNVKDNMKILHPLPRVNEIAYDVDENPHAYYIQQARTDSTPAKLYSATCSASVTTSRAERYRQS
jgi:aspartate carbamoyltransferase catalytic subunit